MVAKVAVARAVYAIDKPYDYLVPGELEPRLRPGMRVLVPFGSGNRGSDGLVLALREEADGAEGLKPITAALDPEPALDGTAVRLALWRRERYFCTVYDAVKAMLPAGLYFSLRDWIVLKKGMDRTAVYEAAEGSAPARQLAELLLALGGRGDMEQIRAAFGPKDPEPAIRRLLERGAAERVTSAQRGVGDKVEKLAVLAMPAEEAMALVTPRRRTAPLRFSVTELLCQLGSASAKELCYFTGASMQTLRSLEKSGVLTLERQEVFRRVPLDDVEPAGPICLNEEQERAFRGLDDMSRAGAAAALLYGVTGSGKTLVYISLIQRVLSRGKTALVLVPEIALTPQLLRIFAAHFGGQIGVLHSSLRAGERYDEWKRIRRGEARVVIGTRSAVFAPLERLGLVILDEEQEASYKSENNPRYHARDVAKYRCVQSGALLVMGSATPSVETMYSAQTGRCGLFTLKERFNRRALPQVQVVDMKEELRAGNGRAISRPLQQALEDTLVRGEQAILFLNRRGNSRVIGCAMCGWVPECPHCSTNMTYHSASGRAMCHYCGASVKITGTCPVCGGELRFLGDGTERIEADLHALFPGVETLRMVADGQAEALEFIVRAESQFLDVPLKALKLKDSVLVASIIRRGKCRVPSGNDAIELGDRVVVVTTNHGMHELKDILK